MAVFRVHKTRDFTVMSNHHLRDKNLTLKAKGLLSVILSLPDDWKYSIAGLASICKEGTSAVKSSTRTRPIRDESSTSTTFTRDHKHLENKA